MIVQMQKHKLASPKILGGKRLILTDGARRWDRHFARPEDVLQ